VEKAVSGMLAITAAWEQLAEGEPEERACFARIGIRYDRTWLTDAHDTYVNRIRNAPLLSAYHLAEWLAWHWWRLRWEPRTRSDKWAFAHKLSTIGEGYIWPNITIFTDGARTALLAKPTNQRLNTPFRYINDLVAIVPAREFENAVDQFIEQVRGQLREEAIASTNLDLIWDDVRKERAEVQKTRYRKIEALLGCDPDEPNEEVVNRVLADGAAVGESGMEEVAADADQGGTPSTVESLEAIAKDRGFDASPGDAVRMPIGTSLPSRDETPAWKLGADLAGILRAQEHLDGDCVSNQKLAELAGVDVDAVKKCITGGAMSFALDCGPESGRVVLRSKWPTGRRFELARLLADRLANPSEDRLYPATRAYTYRQKMQRSFAAEFLSPFDAVDRILAGDYSMESQCEVAKHFQVSDLTIRTLLVNHRRLDREELDEEFDVAEVA
jgi:hypothetical protein